MSSFGHVLIIIILPTKVMSNKNKLVPQITQSRTGHFNNKNPVQTLEIQGLNSGLSVCVFFRENKIFKTCPTQNKHPWKYLCCHAGWSWGCWRRVQPGRKRSGGHSAVRPYPLRWRSGSPERSSHHTENRLVCCCKVFFIQNRWKRVQSWITAVKPMHMCITFERFIRRKWAHSSFLNGRVAPRVNERKST